MRPVNSEFVTAFFHKPRRMSKVSQIWTTSGLLSKIGIHCSTQEELSGDSFKRVGLGAVQEGFFRRLARRTANGADKNRAGIPPPALRRVIRNACGGRAAAANM